MRPEEIFVGVITAVATIAAKIQHFYDTRRRETGEEQGEQ